MSRNHALQGVWPAATLPFEEDGSVAYSKLAEHVEWLVESGCTGVVVNGSLGEYETLTQEERSKVVATAIDAIGSDRVIPGVSDKSADLAVEWARHAKDLEVPMVMALPPTSHAPTEDELVLHFRKIAEVGLPIIAYNNPWSTRAALTPSILARLATEVPEIVAVKDFSQDVRTVLQIMEVAPSIQVIAGCDDVLLESVVVGARGWIAGFVNAFPEQSVALYDMVVAGDLDRALPLYREMLPILRWDADPRFVQAIKLGQEVASRYGGPVRLPRTSLPEDEAAEVISAAKRALEAGTG